MDTLPPELLGMIADSIQEDPLPFQRQRTLAALARTNKTFYSICNHRLYLDPILHQTNKKKWIRFYCLQVNPFTLAKNSTGFESIVIPRSITFKEYDDDDDETEAPAAIKQALTFFDDSRLATINFRPSLFRNLTSFSDSRSNKIDDEFLAALFGPFCPSRYTINNLALSPSSTWRLVAFLFESVSRNLYYLEEEDLLDVLPVVLAYNPHGETQTLIRNRLMAGEDPFEEVEEVDEIVDTAQRLAAVRYTIFEAMSLVTGESVEVLPFFLETRVISLHPFPSLRSLSLTVADAFDLYLIFYSQLCATLLTVKLSGELSLDEASLKHDVKLLCHSVTERDGSIDCPDYDEDTDDLLDSFGHCWKALSKEDIETEPKISYTGPNLSFLDLSDLWIVVEDED